MFIYNRLRKADFQLEKIKTHFALKKTDIILKSASWTFESMTDDGDSSGRKG